MSAVKLPNERSRLLRSDTESLPEESSVVDHESVYDEEYHSQSIRRLSSANLPPYHEDYPATEEPSSTIAIWTVVPVSLLGE